MFWLAPFLLFQLQQPLDIPDKNPHTTAADIEQGKRLYMATAPPAMAAKGPISPSPPSPAPPPIAHSTASSATASLTPKCPVL